MSKLTIDWIKDNGLLVLEVITGSKAYGLDTAKSDTDIRGVFVLPKDLYYGLEYTEQSLPASGSRCSSNIPNGPTNDPACG
jgi:predicted nucleotidyltransferase